MWEQKTDRRLQLVDNLRLQLEMYLKRMHGILCAEWMVVCWILCKTVKRIIQFFNVFGYFVWNKRLEYVLNSDECESAKCVHCTMQMKCMIWLIAINDTNSKAKEKKNHVKQ